MSISNGLPIHWDSAPQTCIICLTHNNQQLQYYTCVKSTLVDYYPIASVTSHILLFLHQFVGIRIVRSAWTPTVTVPTEFTCPHPIKSCMLLWLFAK